MLFNGGDPRTAAARTTAEDDRRRADAIVRREVATGDGRPSVRKKPADTMPVTRLPAGAGDTVVLISVDRHRQNVRDMRCQSRKFK